MRIGIYDPYLDDVGGGEKYILTAAECLSRNHDVTLFWDNIADLNLAKTRFNLPLTKVRFSQNIFSHKFGLLKKIAETRKYDAIIFLSDGSVPISFSRKLFIHIQRPITGFGHGLRNKLKLTRVNKIFCNSYFTKSYIDRETGINSTVIYPPVDLRPQESKKENIILHVGRFRVMDITVGTKDYKKQYIMVDTFKKISKKIPKWEFILAVSVKESDKEDFERLVASTKNYPIKFLVNKTNKELWEQYSKAKIYWHASGFGENLERHPEFAEHFGISTVEAMGGGAVPVVFNAGGQKEIVEDNVSGLLWNSLSELEEKTLYLTSEDKILSILSAEAVKRAKDFEGKRFCDEINRMIEA